MLIVALVTGVVAAISVPTVWWLHGVVDVMLVGYLVYLRRQVRLEEAIRERRAARMAGTRRTQSADDPELDEWARRGREAIRRPAADRHDDEHDEYDDGYDGDGYADERHDGDPDETDPGHHADRPDRERPERVHGTGEPLRTGPGRHADAAEPLPDPVEGEPALPRLRPAPPPPLPAGTALVEASEADLELHDLAGPTRPDYRRAAGE
jgi:hypothetical protein